MPQEIYNGHGMCFICEEAIFNPLCSKCIVREVTMWLDNKSPDIIKEVNKEFKFIKKLNGHTKNKMTCASCSRQMDLCPYCTTEIIYEVLKNKNRDLIPEFLKFFNFDFDGNGYTEDAKKLSLT